MFYNFIIIIIIRFLAESLVSFYNWCREIQTQFAVFVRINIRNLLGINANRKRPRRSTSKTTGKKNSVLEISFLEVKRRMSNNNDNNNNNKDDDQNSLSSSSDSDENDVNDEILRLIEQQNSNRKVSEDLISYIPLKQRLRTAYLYANRKHDNNCISNINQCNDDRDDESDNFNDNHRHQLSQRYDYYLFFIFILPRLINYYLF